MSTPNPIFKDGSVTISISEFENLIACKKELIATKEFLKQMVGDHDGL